MPFYRFLIHGRDPNAPDAHGFYTTRHAFGVNQETAAAKIAALLTREFTSGVSAAIWRGGAPLLEFEDPRPIGLRQFLTAPNKGSTFYDERDETGPIAD